jgi:4-amino-4-deoxy-L-arabinose transferase-like glycosyltransferase
MSDDAASHFRERAIWPFQLVVLYVIVLRLWFDIIVNPMGDEAYYWIWGQRLQLSYFDHPPLHAWLQGLVAAIFGWSPFSLRLLTWVSFLGSLGVLWRLSLWRGGDSRRYDFWTSAAVFATLPVVTIFTTPAFHDHLLVFLCLAAILLLVEFTARWEAGQPKFRLFYSAAVLVGLAILTKYNGVLLAVGFAVFLAVRVPLRPLWRTPHPYLAALIVLAIQTPVLWWNLSEHFATLRFHFTERPQAHWGTPNGWGWLAFLGLMVLPLGPFFLLGLILLPFARLRDDFVKLLRSLTLTIFLVSTVCFAVAAMFTEVLLHWNIVAYVAAATVGDRVLARRWLLWPHLALGAYLLSVTIWNYSIAPARMPLFYDPGTAQNYGWSEVAVAVAASQREHPEAFLAATRYNYAAPLAFLLHDPSVTAFNALPSQYDLWNDPKTYRGRDAIVVADSRSNADFTATQFRSMVKLKDVPVYRFGRLIWTFEIYLARNYVGGRKN